MKNTIIKLFFIVCLFLSFSGNNKLLQSKKDIEIKSFLDFYVKEIIKKDTIILLKNTPNKDFEMCLNDIKNEHTNYDFIKSQFSFNDTTLKIIWNTKSISKSILIDSANIYNISQYKEWVNFKKKFGLGYYAISYPIVSNDLKSILFYSKFYCGVRCGYSQLGLYQKTKTGWTLIKNYCYLVS